MPAHAGILDPWDYRYNDPRCWPKDYFEEDNILGRKGTCGGIAGNIFVPPTYPTTLNILKDCASRAGRCTFIPKENFTFLSTPVKVSTDQLSDCTGTPVNKSVDWTHRVGWTNTLRGDSGSPWGVLKDIFSHSLRFNYGQTWVESTTTKDVSDLQLSPFHIGWWERRQQMRRVVGQWQISYAEPHWGAKVWTTPDDTWDGPASADAHGDLTAHERPMTGLEINQLCLFWDA